MKFMSMIGALFCSVRQAQVLPACLITLAGLPGGFAADITIDGAITYQTIDGFGSCGAHWSAGDYLRDPQVARLWNEDLRCSILRSGIPSQLLKRPVDSVDEVSYRNFLAAASGDASIDFTAAVFHRDPSIKCVFTAWSPPFWMKTNGQAGGGSLRSSQMGFYAKYLTEFVRYMQLVKHVQVYAISPQNELCFAEPYDSCIYNESQYAQTIAAIGNAFDADHLTTKIFGPEDMTDFSGRVMSYVNAIAGIPAAHAHFSIVATHGYVDGVLSAGDADGHNALWHAMEGTGLPLWMTETSGESPAWPKPGAAHTVDALTLGTKMHNALVYGHCSAWVYWCMVGDFTRDANNAQLESLIDRTTPTKKYFVSKQYYRWIRPGSIRIAAGPDGTDGVLVSAYKHRPDALTVVLINHAEQERPVVLTLRHLSPASLRCWRTSATEDCAALPDLAMHAGQAKLTLPPLSITTCTTYTEAQIALPPAH